MNKHLYRITRAIALIIVMTNIVLNYHGYLYRNCALLFSLLLFFIVSKLYQKKTILFTPTYLVYFCVVFIMQNIIPYTYINNSMLLDNTLSILPKDNYYVYFSVFLLISMTMLIYLLIIKNKKNIYNIIEFKPNVKSAKVIFIFSIICILPLQFILNAHSEISRKLMIPFSIYFISNFVMFKEIRLKKIYILGLIFSIAIVTSQLSARFIAIQYIFPICLIYIYKNILIKNNDKFKFRKKMTLYIATLIIIIYGIISEMKKLDKFVSYKDIFDVFSNMDIISYWLKRQIYRIFGIWTNLGGNIIDYVEVNGFFYGLTYIKFLAPIFNFEYVSLPTISAKLVGANYAQPGLVAEGYANFGIIGAVLNVICVLALTEIIWNKFLRRPNMYWFLMLSIPFTSIVFDGGTLNSIIFMILIINLTYIPVIIKKIIK